MTEGMTLTPDDGCEANNKSMVVLAYVVNSDGTSWQSKICSISIIVGVLVLSGLKASVLKSPSTMRCSKERVMFLSFFKPSRSFFFEQFGLL